MFFEMVRNRGKTGVRGTAGLIGTGIGIRGRGKPKLLLCDEPTGALDYNTGKSILKLLQTKCREDGMTVVLITHNSAIAPMANRVISMRSGKVIGNVVNPSPKPVEEIEW